MINLSYSINFSSTIKEIDSQGQLSNEDSIQQQSSFASNSLVDSAVKRIDIQALPTFYSIPNTTRIYDIDLSKLQIDYVRVLHAKSIYQFLISSADTIENLTTAPRQLVKDYVIDKGVAPDSNVFTPDIPYERFIRLINPIEINGGGSGNDSADTPILISLFIVTTKI